MNKLDKYGCPYKFAIDYLIMNGNKLEEKNNNYGRQVIKIAIEVLEEKINKRSKNMTRKEIDLYFLGGLITCHIINRKNLPDEARYICTTEGYDLYDEQDKFYAVEVTK